MIGAKVIGLRVEPEGPVRFHQMKFVNPAGILFDLYVGDDCFIIIRAEFVNFHWCVVIMLKIDNEYFAVTK